LAENYKKLARHKETIFLHIRKAKETLLVQQRGVNSTKRKKSWLISQRLNRKEN